MNIMRRWVTPIKWICFLLLLAGALSVAAGVTERKESLRKYADLKKAAPLTDVLFLGSSHVINGIDPVLLYEEEGIASLNLGGHGSILPASYYELLLALSYASPRLVVVDGYMMDRDYHYLDEMTEDADDAEREASVSQLHLNLDVFPPGRTKLHAVRDLIADRGTRFEFLFPFLLYHNRWSALTADDVLPVGHSAEDNHLLGAEIRMGVDYRISPHEAVGEEVPDGTIHLGEQYLQMILAACRERDIDVALTFLPCNSTVTDRQTAERLEAVAAAEDLPCINLLKEPVVDPRTDYNDEGHLNLLGMTKVTRRIGTFLREHTDLPDRRGEEAYALWAHRAAERSKRLTDLLYETRSLPEALLLLSQDRTRASAVLYLSGTGAAIGDPAVRNLIDALLPDNTLREAAAAGEPFLLFLPEGEAPVFSHSGYGVSEWEDTALGPLETIRVDHFSAVYLDRNEEENLLDMEEDRLSDAQLILWTDDDNKERVLFNYNTEPTVIK